MKNADEAITAEQLHEALTRRTCCQCGIEVGPGEPRDYDDISGEGKIYCPRCDIFRPEDDE